MNCGPSNFTLAFQKYAKNKIHTNKNRGANPENDCKNKSNPIMDRE